MNILHLYHLFVSNIRFEFWRRVFKNLPHPRSWISSLNFNRLLFKISCRSSLNGIIFRKLKVRLIPIRFWSLFKLHQFHLTQHLIILIGPKIVNRWFRSSITKCIALLHVSPNRLMFRQVIVDRNLRLFFRHMLSCSTLITLASRSLVIDTWNGLWNQTFSFDLSTSVSAFQLSQQIKFV